MASVKDLGGGKYRVFLCNRFKVDGKVNRTSKVITAKSLKDAENQAKALEVDFKRGQQIQFNNAPAFSELVDRWRELKKPGLEYKTQERYEGFLTKHMLPYFGNMKVRDIKALTIETYLNALKKDGVRTDGKPGGYSEKTIHSQYMFIQTLFNLAVKWDLIEYNPCIKVDTPKVHKKEAKYYEQEDIEKLLKLLDEKCEERKEKFTARRYLKYTRKEAEQRQKLQVFNDLMKKTYVWLALATACRRGELIGLTVDNIDFKNNRIAITQVGHYTSEQGIYNVSHLKNGSAGKSIDTPTQVMGQLSRYLKAREDIIETMCWEDSGYVFISVEDGTVTTAGGEMMPDVMSKWFSRFIESNNLPPMPLHGIRHTSISWLINQGVDIKKVADRAGHQSTHTTDEIYGHVFKKTRRETADMYDGLFNSHVAGEDEEGGD